MYSINCKGKLIDLTTPRVMGIINLTPDSFYDGGKTTTSREILLQAERMLKEGASFLDLGGYSSRPGASDISLEEELDRVLPALEAILQEFPEAIISIDTFRSEVARKAISMGAALINDISGGMLDREMINTAGQLKVPYIAMHMRGTPQNMTQNTAYDELSRDVLTYFSGRIKEANASGINDLILDPGFGFSKTRAQSFALLNELELFKELELPILIGISRKSMIYKTLDTTPENALNGTTALHSIALLKGANILRVHDVKEAMECITLISELKRA